MDEATEDRAWWARRDVLYRKLVDGGMVYDSHSAQVHHFNATAAWVWEACQQGKRLGEMVDGLCARYAVDSARARADVEEALRALARAELLQ